MNNDPRLAQLPPDVRPAVAAMPAEERDAYLASLEKVADMAERGEEFTPNMEAPYGYTKSGRPKKKTGPKAMEPGARTKAKVDKTIGLKEMDLSSLDEEHPEDSPDVSVVFGRAPDDTAAAPGVDPEATAASAAAVTAAAAVARDVALEAVLRLPPPEPVWAAKAQRALPPANPDDPFSVGTVEDVEVRLFNEPHHYRLVYVVDEDDTEHDAWAGHDPTGWGAALAMKRVKVDKDADHAPLHKLPKVHPAEIQRQERLAARFEHPEWQGAQGRRREHYQDRDVTGQPTGTWSDGVNTWR